MKHCKLIQSWKLQNGSFVTEIVKLFFLANDSIIYRGKSYSYNEMGNKISGLEI